MNKLSTLVLVATVGLAAPAFAATLSDMRNNPFLLKEDAAPAPAPAMKAEASTKAMKSGKHTAKHHHHAKKAAKHMDAAPAKTDKK